MPTQANSWRTRTVYYCEENFSNLKGVSFTYDDDKSWGINFQFGSSEFVDHFSLTEEELNRIVSSHNLRGLVCEDPRISQVARLSKPDTTITFILNDFFDIEHIDLTDHTLARISNALKECKLTIMLLGEP